MTKANSRVKILPLVVKTRFSSIFLRLRGDLVCWWVFVSVSFDEDNKRAIGILLKAIALFKLSMNEHNRPFYRYGGHFYFYCFESLLWDAQGATEHPIMSSETIEIKMAAVSAKRSIRK